MCKRNSFNHIFRTTLQRHRPCLEQGVATILYQYLTTKIAHKLTSEDREFLQFDFDKSLTKEIDIKNTKCFSYVSCIYNTFWWVGIVIEVNVYEGDLKIEFIHPHGPRKTLRWPSVADKCFVPVSNILRIIIAPTKITGWTNFKTNFESIWKHKMQPCIKVQYILGRFCL